MNKLILVLIFLSSSLFGQQILQISQPTINYLTNRNYDQNNDGFIDTSEIKKPYMVFRLDFGTLIGHHTSYFGVNYSNELVKKDLQEISKYINDKYTYFSINVKYTDYIKEIISELENFEITILLDNERDVIIESYKEKSLKIEYISYSTIQKVILHYNSNLTVYPEYNYEGVLPIEELNVKGNVILHNCDIKKLNLDKDCNNCNLELHNCNIGEESSFVDYPTYSNHLYTLDLSYTNVNLVIDGKFSISNFGTSNNEYLVCKGSNTVFTYVPPENEVYISTFSFGQNCGKILEFKNIAFKNMLLQHTPSIDLNNDGEFTKRELGLVDSLVLNIPKSQWNDNIQGSSMDNLSYFTNLTYLKISDTLNAYYPNGGKVDLTPLNQLKSLEIVGNFYDLTIPTQQIENLKFKEVDGITIPTNTFNSTYYPNIKSIDLDYFSYAVIFNEISTLKYLETFKLKAPIISIEQDLSKLSKLKTLDLSYPSNEIYQDTICVNPNVYYNYNLNWKIDSVFYVTAACGDEITNMIDGKLTYLGQALVNTNNPILDLNGDGLITKHELNLAEKIDLSNNNLSDIEGIYDLVPNVTHLILSDNNLDSINLEKFPRLTYLDVSGNNLNHINFTNKESSEELAVNPLSSNYNSLDTLILSDNNFQNLDVSELNNLTFLNTLNNPNLETICVNQNQLDNSIQFWNKDNQTNYSAFCDVVTNTQNISIQNLLYPNPVSDIVYFSNTLNQITTIEGKIVFVNNNQSFTSLHSLKKGFYLAQFKNGEVIKFILQ
jgi:hypothetical protein